VRRHVFALVALLLAVPARAAQTAEPAPDRPPFAEWLAGLRTEAIRRGVRAEIVDQALAGIEEPQPIIIERDRSQAEAVLSLEQYVKRRLTRKFVRTGREMYGRYRGLLDQVGRKYGVSPSIIAGVWGMESNFGKFSGVRPTIPALATLAYDPRRAAFFRGELLQALEILNRGDATLDELRGSWAGAMGQTQFMPSAYLKFAEDFDGDGRRDIWSSPSDVFASIANYLKVHGWKDGQLWGRQVAVSRTAARRIAADVPRRGGTCQATRDMTIPRPLADWTRLGVRLPRGRPLPHAAIEASLVSGGTTHYLVYANYDALLDYNCAHAYAVSVGLLADRLPSAPASAATPTRRAPARR